MASWCVNSRSGVIPIIGTRLSLVVLLSNQRQKARSNTLISIDKFETTSPGILAASSCAPKRSGSSSEAKIIETAAEL